MNETTAQGSSGAIETEDRWNVNFFKPHSPHARSNKNIVVTMFLIWAISVFGFQLLLIATEKPTPEPVYSDLYVKAWPTVSKGTAGAEEKQQMATVLLNILGKSGAMNTNAADKKVLISALSALVMDVASMEQKVILANDIDALVNTRMELGKEEASQELLNKEKTLRVRSGKLAGDILALGTTGYDKLRRDLLEWYLIPSQDGLSDEMIATLPALVDKYLIHNVSFLSDTTESLGFPFHYWYTAQFLLILFVVLCLVYARKIDKLNHKYGLEKD